MLLIVQLKHTHTHVQFYFVIYSTVFIFKVIIHFKILHREDIPIRKKNINTSMSKTLKPVVKY